MEGWEGWEDKRCIIPLPGFSGNKLQIDIMDVHVRRSGEGIRETGTYLAKAAGGETDGTTDNPPVPFAM